ncbi:MAG: HD domain-containing protein [Deltaproteobacteria bacterium]|nr:HD domain-containing protein [Deltaproteobacteria bacterium]
MLAALGLGALAAIALAWFQALRLGKPVRASIDGALEIARGHFGAQVPVEGKNELSDLAHTFNFMSLELARYDGENKELIERLEKGYVQTIVALANSIDSKDRYTRGHSQRVGDLAMEVGKELGLDGKALDDLRYGGILHDIGKIGAPEHILLKKERLTDDEMKVMREHPKAGAQIVAPVGFLAGVLPAVESHHERWDGAGYPKGLKGDEIPIIARIVTAADTWDACTSTRPYSKAMGNAEAIDVIRNLSGAQLDPKVAEALIRVIENKMKRQTPAPTAA